MNDPISDMLVRIQNAYLAKHKSVEVPYSQVKQQIASLLVKEDYLASIDLLKEKPQNKLRLKLSYKGKTPAIDGIKRISKPGRRIYARTDNIPRALGGVGLTILSTSKGIMSDSDARKEKVGGEVICQVW